MMKIILLAVLTLATLSITGCASSKQTYTQGGRVGHTINCSGTARNWGMCYSKAGEICGAKGYDVVQKSDEGGFGGGGSNSGFGFSTLHYRSMTVACKE